MDGVVLPRMAGTDFGGGGECDTDLAWALHDLIHPVSRGPITRRREPEAGGGGRFLLDEWRRGVFATAVCRRTVTPLDAADHEELDRALKLVREDVYTEKVVA